jgi:hypothetical protein
MSFLTLVQMGSLLTGLSNKKNPWIVIVNATMIFQLVSLWFKKYILVLYPSFNYLYLFIYLLGYNTKISIHVMKNFSKKRMWISMKFLLLWNVQSFNLYKFVIMYLNNPLQRIRSIVSSPYLILFYNFFDYSST